MDTSNSANKNINSLLPQSILGLWLLRIQSESPGFTSSASVTQPNSIGSCSYLHIVGCHFMCRWAWRISSLFIMIMAIRLLIRRCLLWFSGNQPPQFCDLTKVNWDFFRMGLARLATDESNCGWFNNRLFSVYSAFGFCWESVNVTVCDGIELASWINLNSEGFNNHWGAFKNLSSSSPHNWMNRFIHRNTCRSFNKYSK